MLTHFDKLVDALNKAISLYIVGNGLGSTNGRI